MHGSFMKREEPQWPGKTRNDPTTETKQTHNNHTLMIVLQDCLKCKCIGNTAEQDRHAPNKNLIKPWRPGVLGLGLAISEGFLAQLQPWKYLSFTFVSD